MRAVLLKKEYRLNYINATTFHLGAMLKAVMTRNFETNKNVIKFCRQNCHICMTAARLKGVSPLRCLSLCHCQRFVDSRSLMLYQCSCYKFLAENSL